MRAARFARAFEAGKFRMRFWYAEVSGAGHAGIKKSSNKTFNMMDS
jgi:hypothetical protein